MQARVSMMAGLLLWSGLTMAQVPSEPYSPLRGPGADPRGANQDLNTSPLRPGPMAGPNQPQPGGPQVPMIERRGPAQGTPSAQPIVPFVLSPAQAEELDRALTAWEQRNKEVKSFECDFACWKYDAVFGNPNADPNAPNNPKPSKGILKYAAPDKGLFKLEGDQPEQWICDGKSVYEFKFPKKEVCEHRLAPELQGKAISDGPLPFVFGTEAQRLKQRYFMRVITPADADGEVWLEAYPRYQRDATEFKKVEVILKTNGMVPYAINLISPNGKDRTVYQFQNVVVNARWRILGNNWFHVSVPFGWKLVPDDTAQAPMQANRAPEAR